MTGREGWQLLFRQGYQSLQNGKYEQTIRINSWLIRLGPRSSMAYNNRGYARYCLHDLDAALDDFHQAIKLNHYNTRAYVNRGQIYIDRGEFDQALANYNEMIDHNPHTEGVYFNRGLVYYNMENYAAAIEDFSRAIEETKRGQRSEDLVGIHPLNEVHDSQQESMKSLSHGYVLRGISHFQNKNAISAMNDIQQALAVDATNKYAYYNRGYFYHVSGKPDLALADYLRAIDIDNQFAYPYAGRAKLLFESGDFAAAQQDFEQARDLESTELYALAGLAVTQHALGENQAARALWRSLIEKDACHKDADWLAEEYGWNTALVNEAKQLMVGL